MLKKYGFQAATISLIGDNLAVWDKVKLWDPGQASSNGAKISITTNVYTPIEPFILK